ncbi:MAG: hypothetical protein IPH02_02540 [Sphingobacteriales bacterium]|nr:hypothetical protein [Sphingobacteriales bacterium]
MTNNTKHHLKTKFWFAATLLLCIVLGIASYAFTSSPKKFNKTMPMTPPTDNYEKDWQTVVALENEGRTLDAEKAVNAIYEKATAQNNIPQQVKALLHIYKYHTYKEENSQQNIVNELKQKIATSQPPLQPLLQNILAGVYWQHFQNNRWQILNRTEAPTGAAEDFETWDANRLTLEITNLYLESLKNTNALQNISLAGYSAILNEEAGSKQLRPSLYDLLAHNTLDYFTNDQANITKAADQFELNQPEAFAEAANFSGFAFANTDTLSTKYYALQIFQALTRFHLNDKDIAPLLDLELNRLNFAYNNSTLPGKAELRLEAHEKLQKIYSTHPESALISYEIAKYWQQQGNKYNAETAPSYQKDLVKAVDICNKAIEKFPDSRGATNCKALIARIKGKSLNAQVEASNAPDKLGRALVQYKNIDHVFCRWIHTTPAIKKEIKRINADWNDREAKLMRYLTSLAPEKTWQYTLPNDKDYQPNSAEISTQSGKIGEDYILLLSADEKFTADGSNALAYSEISITNLAIFENTNGFENTESSYYVVNRQTGQPLPNIAYSIWLNRYNNRNSKYEDNKFQEGITDKNGAIVVKKRPNEYGNIRIELTNNNTNDHLTHSNYLNNSYASNNFYEDRQTFFFTDRSIYRPGQTIFFKGIMLTSNGKGKNKLLTDTKSTVKFYDVNGEMIASLDLKTNEYGSFNGKFTAPTGLLKGSMTISNDHGSTNVQVEEYKRPKFEVTFKPVEGTYKIDEQVTVKGQAKAYAGSNIDNAQVKYRVVRRANYPFWCWWWRPYPSSPEREIANGTALTDANGEFTIQFVAIPDRSLDAKDRPQFTYVVTADITDLNGETRSSTTNVNVGYVALLANIGLPDNVNRDTCSTYAISTQNLNGQFEAADVHITIHKLQTPNKVLRKRLWGQPTKFVLANNDYTTNYPNDIYNNENRPDKWPLADKIIDEKITTKPDSKINIEKLCKQQNGHFLAELTTKDKFGQEVKWQKYFTLFSFDDDKIPDAEQFWAQCSQQTAQPGQTIMVSYGSALENAYYLLEVKFDDKLLRREWLPSGKGQQTTKIKVDEAWRGGFAVYLTCVSLNRTFSQTFNINVPWSNKDLSIETQTFRNKLLPGQNEEWRFTVKGPKGEKMAAEMVATLYDASLDAFLPHSYGMSIYPTYYYHNQINFDNLFSNQSAQVYDPNWNHYPGTSGQYYDALQWFGFSFYQYRYMSYRFSESRAGGAMPAAAQPKKSMKNGDSRDEDKATNGIVTLAAEPEEESKAPVIDGVQPKDKRNKTANINQKTEADAPVQIRKNLNETAFFMPHLQTNEKGELVMVFTIPEALTRWNLKGLAHTKNLEIGYLNEQAVTQKDLMVMPNPPRFMREDDAFAFSAKVSNLTDKPLTGTAELLLFDALTMQPVDALFNNKNNRISFNAAAGQSSALNWQIQVPESVQAVTWRVVVRAGNFSDGEENSVPVLTNRMLVTETMPLPIRGKQTKNFIFTNLEKAQQSNTLKHQSLTLEYTSQPAWYAIQALPYLMEFPYECTEQIYSRYYANSIASHIANSDPRIRKVFDTWTKEALAAANGNSTQGQALLSNLEKNQELKMLLLQETPWVAEAKNESERKKRLGTLLDIERMTRELKGVEKELLKRQNGDGGFSWFPGMPTSRWVTQHIVSGFGHLQKLGIRQATEDPDIKNMLQNAVAYLDRQIDEDYQRLVRAKVDLEKDHLGYTETHYLYTRSFYTEWPVAQESKKAVDFYLKQANKYWLTRSKYLQGFIALALHRFNNGDNQTAQKIIESMRQNATYNEEMGMYFKDVQPGWYWYQAPIETQALLIEAFDEVGKDAKSVEEMRIWLLKQKQTQDWKTTKATAEACYALLLKGTSWLASDQLVEITIGNQTLNPRNMPEVQVEAGTGYFKTNWTRDQIQPNMKNITVSKKDEGPGWGAIYWQYFENLDKITPAATPLNIKKQVFKEEITKSGAKLVALTDNARLKVGDRVKVRIEIRVDRDMEYVHLKDMRAAGFEPENVLSRYKWQEGLGYYESTGDAATNFFIDWLPKGTYVFEYPMRAQLKGNFSNGITAMQCMYAPEFASHSEGIRLTIE